MLTESEKYFALCDARDAFAAASKLDPMDGDASTLETLDAMIAEHAERTRDALQPARYDLKAMLCDVQAVAGVRS